MLHCLAGGALMGWGSRLIPGSNDDLVLAGMPLRLHKAWSGRRRGARPED